MFEFDVMRKLVLQENQIKHMGKIINNQARYMKSMNNWNGLLAIGVICAGLSGLIMSNCIDKQQKEIEILKKKVKNLEEDSVNGGI